MIRSCLGMLTLQTGRMTQTERMTSVIMLKMVTAYCKLPLKGQFDGKNIHGLGSWHWNAAANREKASQTATAATKL